MNAYEPNGLDQPLAPSSGDMHQEPTMPLGIGGMESGDPGDLLAGAGGRKKPNAGALLLVGVIVVGICGLIVMKKLASAGAAIPIDHELDERIKAVLNPSKGGTVTSPEELARKERLLSVLNESYHERQVPLVNVARNPFVVFEDTVIIAQPIDIEDPADVQSRRWQRERDEKRQFLVAAGKTLQLKSVMMGSKALANISGKIVREGDTILASRDNVPFTVGEITASSAVLTSVDETYDLEVEITLVIDRN